LNRYLRLGKRRGVSETIGTILIIAVTVVGAVLISNVMQNMALPISSGADTSSVRPESLQLIGYDTRDSTDLSDVTGLDNVFNQLLNTTTPIVDKIPSEGGTEFIVLHLRNTSINSVFLQNVFINNQDHTWDTIAAGDDLIPTHDTPTTGQFPADGKFSILPITNGTANPIKQMATNEVVGDQEVRVLVKLSGNIPQDIGMWESMRIHVNYGGTQPAEFIVLSGDAKW